MSCGALCPCQFNWPLDTHGSKRDNITSEKAWLDFAVRCLSREAAGKGNGQETVWSVACKPTWWDSNVGLPWKNPTTNPKDSKDSLLKKYEALEKHLRVENRFPSDLEEEAKLWADGKYKELFLQCNLTCLLRKVSGVHLAIVEANTKADKMKAQINQAVLENIRTCLNSALRATDNFKCKEPIKQFKRKLSQNKENQSAESSPYKKLKQTNINIENDKRLVPILPKPEQASITSGCSNRPVTNMTLSASNSNDILRYANKILEKRKISPSHAKMALAKKIMKSCKLNTENLTPSEISGAELVPDHNSSSSLTSPLSIEMMKLSSNNHSIGNSVPINICAPSFVPGDYGHGSSSASPLPVAVIESTLDGTAEPDLSFNTNSSFIKASDHFSEIDFLLSPLCNEDPNSNSSHLDILQLSSSESAHIMQNNIASLCEGPEPLGLETFNSTSDIFPNVENDSVHLASQGKLNSPVLENNLSPRSTVSETYSCPQASDGGYISAEDLNLDFDEIVVEEEELYPLLDVNGSYSLDRYLFDNTVQQPSVGEVSLLDQWDDMNHVLDSSEL